MQRKATLRTNITLLRSDKVFPLVNLKVTAKLNMIKVVVCLISTAEPPLSILKGEVSNNADTLR